MSVWQRWLEGAPSEEWGEERPRTRADCDGRPRPCPYLACRYHLLVDISPGGGVVLNVRAEGDLIRHGRRRAHQLQGQHVPRWKGRPTRERNDAFDERVLAALESGAPTCALDVAEEGDHTLEQVGALLHLTRERVRQVEAKALKQLQRARDSFEDVPDRIDPMDLVPMPE